MDRNQKPEFDRTLDQVLQDALKTGDFSELSESASQSLRSAVDATVDYAKSIRDSASFLFGGHPYSPPKYKPPVNPPGAAGPQRPPYQGRPSPPPSYYAPGQAQNPQPRPAYTPPRQAQGPDLTPMVPPPAYLQRRNRDMAMGMVAALAGLAVAVPVGIVTVAWGLSTLFGMLGGAASMPVDEMITLGLLAGVSVSFFFLARKGIVQYGRAKRFKDYWNLLRYKGYCAVQAFSNAVRKPKKLVLSDLKYWIRSGNLPGGRLDDQQQFLLLGDELYGQYQAAKEGQKKREATKDKKDIAIQAGLEAVRQIRSANAALPDAVVTEKLTRLEDVTANIFAYVEQHPAKLAEIRRFMDYYLPTTVKLVQSYQNFDGQPQTASVTAAKGEILTTLDVINAAFETLLDGLYQDDAMDVSADISVLKTMLAQEGLTGNDFPGLDARPGEKNS
ncbi:MAG: hypothetical protein HFJ86_11080 [Oscillospiraceae bacterium]|jgi:5-bromo-4-chloroindolyl phosphate hydrolysis protein|nr:hypothetical protein [Oscillospiraceae bacterium]